MEMKEKQLLIKEYRDLANSATTIVDRIKYTISADALEFPMSDIIANTIPLNYIGEFRRTFLSNFYIADVVYQGVTFPSSEHAYQSAKFDTDVFIKLLNSTLN